MIHRVETSLAPEHWGVLATRNPFSCHFGLDRGAPIDRIFIDTFLGQHRTLIRGRVLEVGDDRYSRRYGNGAVTVVDIHPDASAASIVADLARPGSLLRARFNCAIVTQSLQYVEDMQAAAANLHDCLAPGGTLLVTAPGITCIDPGDGRACDRWRFTPQGLSNLLASAFGPDGVTTTSHGDLHTATAFLYGLAEDIGLCEGDGRTGDFPVVVCCLAVRR